MSKLPNGNLLCRNVPIARVGFLIYGPDEVPVKTGQNGVSYVERTDDALFNPQTMGSFMAAAVVDDHPDDDVTPANYSKVAGGFAINVRRGTGADHDVMLADLVLTSKHLIDAVLSGKREVSAGYDADYEDLGNGRGKQFNIIGNHIALVEKGRCGPRCAIGDSEFKPQPAKEQAMPTQRVQIRGTPAKRRATLDTADLAAARQRFADAQAALEVEEEKHSKTDDKDSDAGEGEGGSGVEDAGAIHVHLHTDAGGSPVAGVKAKDAESDEPETDPNDDRMTACETAIAAIGDQVKQILAAVRGKSPTSDEEAEEDDDTITDAESEEDDKSKAKTDDKEGEEEGESVKETKESKKGDEDDAEDDPKKDKKTDDKSKTKDSAALATGYQALLSQAEILVPGFKTPTFDAALPRAKTVDRMCGLRRKVLDHYAATSHGATMLIGLNEGKAPELLDLGCAEVAVMFKSAAAAQGAINNAAATQGANKTATQDAATKTSDGRARTLTPAEINAANAKFWEPQLVK